MPNRDSNGEGRERKFMQSGTTCGKRQSKYSVHLHHLQGTDMSFSFKYLRIRQGTKGAHS
jgi:hypothetical protein